MEDPPTPPPAPPDGGWGWLVVLGAFAINLLTAGSSWAFGVLYVALLDALRTTKAETALVGSLMYMVLVFMAPYASAACRKYGHRLVIMAGGATASIAIIGSSFATSVTQLYYTYGVLTGFGYGCCLVPSFLIVQQYFKKRMGVAIGIAMAGGGLGMFIMALLTQQLLSEYGWKGTLLILGAINVNLCVAGALMRPVSHVKRTPSVGQMFRGYNNIQTSEGNERTLSVMKTVKRKYSLSVVATYLKPVVESTTTTKPNDTNCEIHMVECNNENRLEDRKLTAKHGGGILENISEEVAPNGAGDPQDPDDNEMSVFHSSNKDIKSSAAEQSIASEENSEGQHTCRRYPRMVLTFFDGIYNFSLFKDPVYDLFQASVMAGFIGMSIVTTHVVKRALDFGMSHSRASSLVYGMGIGQAVGRTLGGVAVDHVPVDKIVMCAVTLFFTSAATAVSTYFSSYIGQQAFIFVIGCTFGAVAVISMGVLVDIFGANLLSYTISVCYVVGGIGTIVGPTIAGYLRDKYGEYDSAFHLAAAADAFCAVLMLFMMTLIRFVSDGRRTHEPVVNKDRDDDPNGDGKPNTTSVV